jgi:hypothetical protein
VLSWFDAMAFCRWLQVVEPGAIAAAVAAEAEAADRRDQVRAALLRELEAARYAADRAFRQYDAADPLPTKRSCSRVLPKLPGRAKC